MEVKLVEAGLDQSRDAVAVQALLDTTRLEIEKADREVLRRLAGQVAAIAARAIEEVKRNLWREHNALGSTRPLIFCDPEYGWNEIITPDQMECRGTLARQWEMHLRKEVFWGVKMNDDYIVSMKPSPTDLAMDTFDEERVRTGLREAFRSTLGCRVEVIMKDNHTIRNDPRRVVRWVQIAREEAERL